MRRHRPVVAAVLGAALLLLALSGTFCTATLAAGARSTLTLRECFSDVGGEPCQKVPHHSLGIAGDIAVSPDGTGVYVASRRYRPAGPGVDTITEFTRDADGTLHPVGCLAFGGAHGCRPSRAPLEGVDRLAISPDGHDLYAITAGGLTEFSREADGRLQPIGCITLAARRARGAGWCKRPAGWPALIPNDVVPSPDGADLYVTGAMKERGFPRAAWVGGIYEFARRADGTVAPTPLGCFGPTDARRCGAIASYYPLQEPVMAPDGSALYAIGYDAIWRFPRTADGSLGAPECALAAGPGCALGYPSYESLAIGAAGSPLYLGTFRETAAYSIAPNGALTKVAARRIPSDLLALSPDGSRLYGAAYGTGHGGIRAFAVGGDALSPLGGPFLAEDVEGMALTPDGATLLATTSCTCGGLLDLATGQAP
ncbi:MAG TPA: hypothetical protein VMH33_14090 [Solirubrobacterales bacterium]|nr:hypothetical protein [Solirubrobacterales bacterium]